MIHGIVYSLEFFSLTAFFVLFVHDLWRLSSGLELTAQVNLNRQSGKYLRKTYFIYTGMCVCVYFNSKMENINLFTLHFSDRYEFHNLLIFIIKLELQYSGIPLLIHSDNHNNKWTCFGGQKWKKRPLTSPFVRRSTPVSKSSAVVPGI